MFFWISYGRVQWTFNIAMYWRNVNADCIVLLIMNIYESVCYLLLVTSASSKTLVTTLGFPVLSSYVVISGEDAVVSSLGIDQVVYCKGPVFSWELVPSVECALSVWLPWCISILGVDLMLTTLFLIKMIARYKFSIVCSWQSTHTVSTKYTVVSST